MHDHFDLNFLKKYGNSQYLASIHYLRYKDFTGGGIDLLNQEKTRGLGRKENYKIIWEY